MRRTVVVWLIAMLPFAGVAQHMVAYDLDFSFKDGIYLSFGDFKANNPVPVTHIISKHDIRLPDYMEQVMEADMVRYYDNFGEERTLKTSALWGYSFGGKAFIQHGDGFFRMPIFGAITHFTAAVTVYRTVSDPMMMNPGMMPYREVPVQELRQFILDMRTGQVLAYTIENTLSLMPADRDLVDDFLKLKKKQQQEGLLLLIRKFNDRYPLYFPE